MKKVSSKQLIDQIERLTRQRLTSENVVSINDYRRLKSSTTAQTILVIEDDESMRKALTKIFELEGHKVVAVSDGVELTKVLEENFIDLIIMDVGLPWINGFELAELMKQHEELKEIPLVFVSGQTSLEDVKRGFAVGADDYVKKPFEINEIRRSVNTLLKLNI